MIGMIQFRFLGVIFFIYLVYSADFNSVFMRWEKVSWIYIIPLPIISGFMLTIRAIRWRLLLNVQGIYLTPYSTWSAYAIGVFCGIITPGRIGDLAKSYFVRQKTGVDWPRALSSTVVDRLMDIVFMGLASLWAIFYLDFPRTLMAFLSVTESLFAIGLLFALVVTMLIVLKINRGIVANFKVLIVNYLKIGLGEAKNMLSATGWKCIALTIVAYGLYFLLTVLLAKSIFLPLLTSQVVAAIVLVGIASYLPISIAGLGTREAMLLLVMEQLKIEKGLEFTLVFSGLFFVFCFVVPGTIGFFCLLRQPLSYKGFRKEIEGKING